jgi:hypothetical protein
MSIKPELPVAKVLMWHTVIHISGDDNKACGVEITTNPYEHTSKAAIIVHKSRSLNVAKQVARYVRRTTNQSRVSVHRAGTAREAKIGYAVDRNLQYPPNERTPYMDVVMKVSSTSVADLLASSDKHDNASRSRFYVYEIRSGSEILGRFVTNKAGSVEKLFLSAPPDTKPRVIVVVVGTAPTYAEAEVICGDLKIDYTKLWTRKPPREYLVRVLRDQGTDGSEDFIFRSTGYSAMRRYKSGTLVQVGPHVYTVAQVLSVLRYGYWNDGRVSKASKEQISKEYANDWH